MLAIRYKVNQGHQKGIQPRQQKSHCTYIFRMVLKVGYCIFHMHHLYVSLDESVH